MITNDCSFHGPLQRASKFYRKRTWRWKGKEGVERKRREREEREPEEATDWLQSEEKTVRASQSLGAYRHLSQRLGDVTQLCLGKRNEWQRQRPGLKPRIPRVPHKFMAKPILTLKPHLHVEEALMLWTRSIKTIWNKTDFQNDHTGNQGLS